MQIVIDIPDDVYRVLKEDIYPIPDTERLALVFKTLVKKGTPLPKGHGRLKDVDALKKDDEVTEWLSLDTVRTGKMLKSFSELFIKKIDATPTIIEADRSEV